MRKKFVWMVALVVLAGFGSGSQAEAAGEEAGTAKAEGEADAAPTEEAPEGATGSGDEGSEGAPAEIPWGCETNMCDPSTFECQEPGEVCYVYDDQLLCCVVSPFGCIKAADCAEVGCDGLPGFPVCKDGQCCADGSAKGGPAKPEE